MSSDAKPPDTVKELSKCGASHEPGKLELQLTMPDGRKRVIKKIHIECAPKDAFTKSSLDPQDSKSWTQLEKDSIVDAHQFKVKQEEREVGSNFKCDISKLVPGKFYYIRASAENDVGKGQRIKIFGAFSTGRDAASVGDAGEGTKPPAKKAKVAHDDPAEPSVTSAPAAAAKAPAAAPATAPKASGSKVPKIKLPTINIKEEEVCKLLLKDVLEHKDVANTSHKGDLLEHICSKVLPTSANVLEEKVELVGAHISGGGGCGDGGKDLIVRKEGRPWVIDCKAYMDGNNVTAKDVRSVMGALMCLQELSSSPATGVVITTSKFTAPAKQAAADFNEINKSANNKEIELWDGQRLEKEMKKAIAKHGGPAAWCNSVLDHLEKNKLITLEK